MHVSVTLSSSVTTILKINIQINNTGSGVVTSRVSRSLGTPVVQSTTGLIIAIRQLLDPPGLDR